MQLDEDLPPPPSLKPKRRCFNNGLADVIPTTSESSSACIAARGYFSGVRSALCRLEKARINGNISDLVDHANSLTGNPPMKDVEEANSNVKVASSRWLRNLLEAQLLLELWFYITVSCSSNMLHSVFQWLPHQLYDMRYDLSSSCAVLLRSGFPTSQGFPPLGVSHLSAANQVFSS